MGSRGADVLVGSDQPNDLDGGGGDGGASGDTLERVGEDDTLHANNPGHSTLNGDGGDDHLYSARILDGGPGDDWLERWSGGIPVAATVTGGPGTDTADYSSWSEPLIITLDGAPNDGVAGLADNVGADVENVTGGRGDDTLRRERGE